MKVQQQTRTVTRRRLHAGSLPLPQSLLKAAGLLRHKRKALQRHQQRVRKEWRGLA